MFLRPDGQLRRWELRPAELPYGAPSATHDCRQAAAQRPVAEAMRTLQLHRLHTLHATSPHLAIVQLLDGALRILRPLKLHDAAALHPAH